MKKLITYFILITLLGCMTTKIINNSLPISIDSYGDENELTDRTYIILPYDSSVASNILLFNELSLYVNRTLVEKGYKLTKNYDSASCIIFFKYGTSSPQTFEREIYLPIYGQTGISSSTTTGSGALKYYPGSTVLNYKTETSYNANYGVVGQRTIKTSETYYAHYLILSAFEKKTLKDDFNRSIRWKIISKVVAKDSDLRRIFPFIILGSQSYIGKNSHQNILSEIKLDDPRLPWLLKGTAFEIKNQKNEIEKQVLLSEDEKRINQLKENSPKLERYKSISEINIGDFSAFKSMYGQIVFGVIESKSSKKIKLKTFPTNGTSVVEIVNWKDLLKILE
jgi:hypothetical protein